jgi:hypothetical protein
MSNTGAAGRLRRASGPRNPWMNVNASVAAKIAVANGDFRLRAWVAQSRRMSRVT